MTRHLGDLVLAWTASSTEKERADVEHEMREYVPDNPNARKNHCGYWITSKLPPGSASAGPRHVMDRAILRRAGAAAEPIWEALAENKFKLRDSGIIIARSRDDGQTPTAEKVAATIQSFLDGTLDKKRPSEAAYTKKPKKEEPPEAEEPTAKKVYGELYAAAERVFDQMLGGVPEFQANQIRAAGRTDLRALTETWRNTMNRARSASTEKLSESVKAKQLRSAMRVLNLDFPTNGEFTPKLRAKIKTHFRQLARLYHPDRAQNNPECVAEYRKVVEANACIQTLLAPASPSPSTTP